MSAHETAQSADLTLGYKPGRGPSETPYAELCWQFSRSLATDAAGFAKPVIVIEIYRSGGIWLPLDTLIARRVEPLRRRRARIHFPSPGKYTVVAAVVNAEGQKVRLRQSLSLFRADGGQVKFAQGHNWAHTGSIARRDDVVSETVFASQPGPWLSRRLKHFFGSEPWWWTPAQLRRRVLAALLLVLLCQTLGRLLRVVTAGISLLAGFGGIRRETFAPYHEQFPWGRKDRSVWKKLDEDTNWWWIWVFLNPPLVVSVTVILAAVAHARAHDGHHLSWPLSLQWWQLPAFVTAMFLVLIGLIACIAGLIVAVLRSRRWVMKRLTGKTPSERRNARAAKNRRRKQQRRYAKNLRKLGPPKA